MHYMFSIRHKSTKKRHIFLANGDFKDHQDFVVALKAALLEPEEFDFRTIRFLEEIDFNQNKILLLNESDEVEAFDVYER